MRHSKIDVSITELGSLGEFVAAIATIATLVYLALQIRFNTKVSQAAVQQESANSFSDHYLELARDPQLRRVVLKMRAGESWASLSEEDALLADALLRGTFNGANRDFMNYKLGICSEQYWMQVQNYIEFGVLETSPMASEWWMSHVVPMKSYDPEFREWVSEWIKKRGGA